MGRTRTLAGFEHAIVPARRVARVGVHEEEPVGRPHVVQQALPGDGFVPARSFNFRFQIADLRFERTRNHLTPPART